MIDGGDGKNNVKMVFYLGVLLNRNWKDPRLRQIELASHALKIAVTFAGVVGSFGQGLKPHHFIGAMQSRPEAEDAFTAANLHHLFTFEVNSIKKLIAKAGKIKPVVPQSH